MKKSLEELIAELDSLEENNEELDESIDEISLWKSRDEDAVGKRGKN
jgi:prefoldin subunit 5